MSATIRILLISFAMDLTTKRCGTHMPRQTVTTHGEHANAAFSDDSRGARKRCVSAAARRETETDSVGRRQTMSQ